MLNRFRIGVRIGAGFAIGLAMLSAIGVLAYRATNALVASSALERHTYEVLGKLRELDVTISTAESAQRGYIVTGQNAYLQDYQAAIAQLDDRLSSLQEITADNLDQQRRVAELEPLVAARIERMNTSIQLRQEQGFGATQQFAAAGEGKRIMQQIRDLAAVIEAEERQLLEQRSRQAQAAAEQTLNIIRFGIPACFAILFLVGLWLSRNISRPLQQLSDTAEEITAGSLSVNLPTSVARDEIGMLTRAFRQMVVSLRQTIEKNEQQRWLKTSLANLSQTLQGQRDLTAIAQSVLSHLVPLLGAQQGALYYLDSAESSSEQNPDSARESTARPQLKRLASYAAPADRQSASTFLLGEGLVGQCALEKQQISLAQVPPGYVPIRSGLGEAPPAAVVVTPLLFESQVQGVIELASLEPFGELELALLEEASSFVGVMINAVSAYQTTQSLLQASQALTDELRQQQQELVHSNQLLEQRTQALQMSELLLQEQQEELQQSNEELQQLNEELEEKADLLEAQKQQVERKNAEIEQARQSLEGQAQQLALSSRYKSEFLANMSHELRTPLNSLLILAKLLSENSGGNLSDKQIEYSRTIYSAGNDLLTLINDILDLAKIESGTMSVMAEPVSLVALQTDLDRTFRPVALSKGLKFTVELAGGLPATIVSDARRLQQILKNLLSNALKFTEQGEVSLLIEPGPADTVAFAVRDSGIGISADKQQVIFEAFQQADGTTSRRYGGTGLGLSISLELARLLKGTIELVSQPQQGSTFTLRLPRQTVAQPVVPVSLPPASPSVRLPQDPSELLDDRDQLNPGDQVLLVIEDDLNFARILIDMARQHRFKVLVATQGQAGLTLAQQYLPSAITLDLHLPDMPGWAVLEQLKRNPTTRHVPIHVMTVEDQQPREFQLGAIAHIQKPVSPEVLTRALDQIKRFIEQQVRHLLVIEDDPVQAQSIIELIGGSDVESTAVSTGAAAMAILKTRPFDCVVLDLGLPDMNGFDLIEQIKQEPSLAMLPIVVYTGKDLSATEETQLRRLAETIIVKDARSPERLLDETALFLHRVQANLPQANQQLLERLHQSDPALAQKQVLIIDDDVRNIFALTSLLEQFGMVVLFAENGRSGLALLEANPEIDVVLMDVMMPELDGYETTRLIRQQERFRTLPIITLTAKAMQGDREKCIDAGASDYISKPVNPDQLLSLLRLWLHR